MNKNNFEPMTRTDFVSYVIVLLMLAIAVIPWLVHESGSSVRIITHFAAAADRTAGLALGTASVLLVLAGMRKSDSFADATPFEFLLRVTLLTFGYITATLLLDRENPASAVTLLLSMSSVMLGVKQVVDWDTLKAVVLPPVLVGVPLLTGSGVIIFVVTGSILTFGYDQLSVDGRNYLAGGFLYSTMLIFLTPLIGAMVMAASKMFRESRNP